MLRPILPFIFAVLSSTVLVAAKPTDRFVRLENGLLRDGVMQVDSGDAVSVAESLLARRKQALFGERAPGLRLISNRLSLTGRHLLFQQTLNGVAVEDADVSVSLDGQGQALLRNRTAATTASTRLMASSSFSLPKSILEPGEEILATREILLSVDGLVTPALRFDTRIGKLDFYEVDVDSAGRLLGRRSLSFRKSGRVFSSNPVTRLNRPDLRDEGNSPAAVPTAAYSTVELLDLAASGSLAGPNVAIVDTDLPSIPVSSVNDTLTFDRSQSGFEEVNTYHHLDSSQRYLQSLGYAGARRIVGGPIPVDVHALNGEDNSFFIFRRDGVGELYFGDGGVDDAEDPDILLHEYGHAILNSISPGNFIGSFASQARAIGEGLSDYWAFSSGYEESVSSGRDPYCIGDWDARCGGPSNASCSYAATADCLRRVDGTKTMAQYITNDNRGVEHQNGEIWSSALRQIFEAIVSRIGAKEGRRVADTLALEGAFGVGAQPTFRDLAQRMINADRLLNGARNVAVICTAMTTRGILATSECGAPPRGESVVLPGSNSGASIPDGNADGISLRRSVTDTRIIRRIALQVDIRHRRRSDLRVELIAPDGRVVVLQDLSAAGAGNLQVTYGYDAEPKESLELFEGRSGAGDWTLRVIDFVSGETGIVNSWALIIEFEGAQAIGVRTAAARSRFIPAAAKATGVNDTSFVTDLRILNTGNDELELIAIFTPTRQDGRISYAAQTIRVAPAQTAAFDDVVSSLFRSTGIGSIEIRGDVTRAVITSRTYNNLPTGTYGQFIESVDSSQAVRAEDEALHLTQLRSDEQFRTNVGFSEVSGNQAMVELVVRDLRGEIRSTTRHEVLPFGHLQLPLPVEGGNLKGGRATVAVVSGSGRVIPYASSVDNQSGDAIYLRAASLPRKNESIHIPAALHADGALGTVWRTDLSIVNGGKATDLVIYFYSSVTQDRSARAITLNAGQSVLLEDVVLSLFGMNAATGHLQVEGLELSRILVTSRTYNSGTAGTFGQAIPGRDDSEARERRSEPVRMIQLENSVAFRTNVGMAEVSGGEAVVRFALSDGDGKLIFTSDQTVKPFEQRQFNLAQIGAPSFVNGRITAQVVSGEGRVFLYASVIDNRSGDPIYIAAR